MHLPNESLSLSWPISSQALEFARQVSQPLYPDVTANQVFDNAIAVSVVQNFLGVLGLTSNRIDPAQSRSPSQLTIEISNLSVGDMGVLECYAVPTNLEDWPQRDDPHHRIGCVFVSLQLEVHQSVIRGFLPSVDALIRPLPPLRSVEYLLQHLHSLMTPFVSITRWLSGVFEPEWQPLDQVLDSPTRSSFRFAESVETPINRPSHTHTVCRAKQLHWQACDISTSRALDPMPEPVVMTVTAIQLVPLSIRTAVQIHPVGQNTSLSPSLRLAIWDDSDHAIMSTTARAIDNYLELRFKGVPGEAFQVEVRQGDYWVLEKFQL